MADLIEHVLGGASQQDGAGLGVLAVHNESEELVANLLNLKQACSCPDVAVLDLLSPVEAACLLRGSYALEIDCCKIGLPTDGGRDAA